MTPTRQLVSVTAALAAGLLAAAAAQAQIPGLGQPHAGFDPDLPTLWLIGDSTVKEGRDDGLNGGRWGWGHEIDRYFDTSRINVENQALGGTSSRSFITGGWWADVLALIEPGDFLIIQFGHNDEGLDSELQRVRARATLPGNGDETRVGEGADGGPATIHSYGWYIRQYIRDARAKGAIPIVASLIPRNDWADGRVIRAQDDSYVRWSREAAAQEGAFWINLNHIIAGTMDELGEDFAVGALFRPDDHTHTITLGAQLNAMSVVRGIKALGDSVSLAAYLAPAAEPLVPAATGLILAP